jgi:hypothetical protein
LFGKKNNSSIRISSYLPVKKYLYEFFFVCDCIRAHSAKKMDAMSLSSPLGSPKTTFNFRCLNPTLRNITVHVLNACDQRIWTLSWTGFDLVLWCSDQNNPDPDESTRRYQLKPIQFYLLTDPAAGTNRIELKSLLADGRVSPRTDATLFVGLVATTEPTRPLAIEFSIENIFFCHVNYQLVSALWEICKER